MKELTKLLRQKQFSFIKRLQKKFPAAEVFLVGGIIRDLLLKRESKDYDFVVRNIPLKQLQQFLTSQGWNDLVGAHFGVIKFTPKNSHLPEPIDITLPRTEYAHMTGGHRDFDVQSDYRLPIEDDLKRRDFTINALAYDVNNKKLIDLFGGLDDLKKKTIKTVGQPGERFGEDYSRMIRGLRFACQLDFNIEKNTWRATQKLLKKINVKKNSEFIVAREVIAKEMVKAFVSNPARAFELFNDSGAIKELMPELLEMKGCPQPNNFHSEGDVWTHTHLSLQNLTSRKFQNKFGEDKLPTELVFGVLFHDLGKPYTIEKLDRLRFNNHDAVGAEKTGAIMERLKLSSAGVDSEKVTWLIARHMLATHTKRSPMKKTTLEKYFYNDRLPGHDLMKLMFADIQATIPKNGQPDFSDFKNLEKQINSIAQFAKRKKALPPEILDGFAIMKELRLPPGPRIGKLKDALREEQLKGTITTKKQAITFLKNHHYATNT